MIVHRLTRIVLGAVALACTAPRSAMAEQRGPKFLIASARTEALGQLVATRAEGFTLADASAHLACGVNAAESACQRLVAGGVLRAVFERGHGTQPLRRFVPTGAPPVPAPLAYQVLQHIAAAPAPVTMAELRTRFPEAGRRALWLAVYACERSTFVNGIRDGEATRYAFVATAEDLEGLPPAARATLAGVAAVPATPAQRRPAVQLRGVPRTVVAGCIDPHCACPVRVGDYDIRQGQLVRAVCRRDACAGGDEA